MRCLHNMEQNSHCQKPEQWLRGTRILHLRAEADTQNLHVQKMKKK